ncbi:MAG: DUF4959 domain-containing protein [Prevotellaceae bacterium]|jgi:hypothetical protein|nr:DUF4959 domain-containing protein [Prevotellaceae bacterium]
MRTIKFILLLAGFLTAFSACKERGRFEIGFSDSEPPDAPEYLNYKSLYGGVRLYFRIPSNEDLLSIDASYTNAKGEKLWFSVSYFADSLDVYGFNDTLEHIVELYAVDRAGNRSEAISIPVFPLEPAVSRVAKTVTVKPGFASFFVDWENELEQNINVYVDFSYTKQGKFNEYRMIFTSRFAVDRYFVNNMELTEQEPVSVKIRVEDMYGNITESIDKGTVTLYEDELIPKDKWVMPATNDSIGGVPMAFLDNYEGHSKHVIDGIIDDGANVNYGNTGGSGRTGVSSQGNVPWNIMIDLGDEYEISRIITHQTFTVYDSRLTGDYYVDWNVATYNMYIWDAGAGQWEFASQNRIANPFLTGKSGMEIKLQGQRGDMAYLYPDDPKFSKPTRWFRYEALGSFNNNYTSTSAYYLSELTLYGKKKNR